MTLQNGDYRRAVSRILGVLEHGRFRLYCRLRFWMLRAVYFRKVGAMLPERGAVLDVACGPGLFTNVFAQLHPGCTFYGFDLEAERLELGGQIAQKLGLKNTHFDVADLRSFALPESLQSAFLFFVLHHVKREEAIELLARLTQALPMGGSLVIKEIRAWPFWEVWFATFMDRSHFGECHIEYWRKGELDGILRALGYEFSAESLLDFLPFPQILYYARRTREMDVKQALAQLMPGGRYRPVGLPNER